MSDCVRNTCSCFSGEVSSSYADEFRLLMRNIFQNVLSNDEVRTFHWYLKLPKRLLEDCTPSVAILQCLEERNFIKNWKEDPTSLKQDLVKAIDRHDLAYKVDELTDKYSNVLAPRIHIVQQESSSVTEEGGQLSNTTLHCQEIGAPLFLDDTKTVHPVAGGTMFDSELHSISEWKVLTRKTSLLRRRPTELETVPEEGCRPSLRSNDTDNEQTRILVINSQNENCDRIEAVSPVHVENGALLTEFLNAKEVRNNFGKKIIKEFASDYNEFCATKRNSDSEHSCLTRADSNASSGYFSHRDSDARLSSNYRDSVARLSSSYCNRSFDANLSSSYRDSDVSPSQVSMLDSSENEDRNYFSGKHVNMSEPMLGDHSPYSPDAHLTVVQPQLQTSQLPASPPPIRKHGVAIKENLLTVSDQSKRILRYTAEPVDNLPAEFRPRSSSFPSKAKALCNQVYSRIRKESTTSSSTSLVSEDSEGPIDSHLSSQMSLLSTDHSSSDSSTDCGSLESVKANSLKREPTVSRISISGQIQIPLKKIFSHISKQKHQQFKSDHFPSLKGQRGLSYDFRFFPSNFSKDSCALYFDVSREYLREKSKRSPTTPIKIPPMEVTASIHISPTETRDLKRLKSTGLGECIQQATETVPASSRDIQDLPGFLQSKQNFVTVTSFPHLVKHSDLEKFLEFPQRNVVIHVVFVL